MDRNQNILGSTCRNSTSKGITAIKASYPTSSQIYSCQTPFTMGLKKIKTPIENAKDKPTSLRLAINAKCFDCIGCGFDPKPAEAIRSCEIEDCSLWLVRPYRNKKARKDSTPARAFNLSLQQNHEVEPL